MIVEQIEENRGRLFSYTDADSYANTEEVSHSVTTASKPVVTPLLAQMSSLRQKAYYRPNTKWSLEPIDWAPSDATKLREHLPIGQVQTYHILADLGNGAEYVLCVLRYFPANFTLCVTPDFSPHLLTGAYKPYRVEVDADAKNTFRYWLEDASEQVSEERRRVEAEIALKLAKEKENARAVAVDGDFKIPHAGHLFVLLLMEIRSVENFEGEHLAVNFRVTLPAGWSCQTPDLLSGTTQSCYTNQHHRGHFGYCVELPLDFRVCLNEVPTWPSLHLSVISLDRWGCLRTQGQVDCSVPNSPGHHHMLLTTCQLLGPQPVHALRRFFIGDRLELAVKPNSHLLNLSLLETKTSGCVEVIIDTVMQSQPCETSYLSSSRLLERLNAAAIFSSVGSILQAFKAARKRMLDARKSAVGVDE